jgi:hypothetical protein
VIIVETTTFTRLIQDLLDEDSYRLLQIELADNPEKGVVIRGTGEIRKIRWSGSGRKARRITRDLLLGDRAGCRINAGCLCQE